MPSGFFVSFLDTAVIKNIPTARGARLQFVCVCYIYQPASCLQTGSWKFVREKNGGVREQHPRGRLIHAGFFFLRPGVYCWFTVISPWISVSTTSCFCPTGAVTTWTLTSTGVLLLPLSSSPLHICPINCKTITLSFRCSC